MECWNVGIMGLPIIPLFQYSTLRKSDIGLARFLTDGNSYSKNRSPVDLAFHGDLATMV